MSLMPIFSHPDALTVDAAPRRTETPMAHIVIRHQFADGDTTEVVMKGRNPSPDAFETMCRQAFDTWSDAMAYALAIQTGADEDVI